MKKNSISPKKFCKNQLPFAMVLCEKEVIALSKPERKFLLIANGIKRKNKYN